MCNRRSPEEKLLPQQRFREIPRLQGSQENSNLLPILRNLVSSYLRRKRREGRGSKSLWFNGAYAAQLPEKYRDHVQYLQTAWPHVFRVPSSCCCACSARAASIYCVVSTFCAVSRAATAAANASAAACSRLLRFGIIGLYCTAAQHTHPASTVVTCSGRP